jgi:hypothetical protein
MLAKCKQIVAAVNKWYHKQTQKYGIEIPKNLMIACELTVRTVTPFGRMPFT